MAKKQKVKESEGGLKSAEVDLGASPAEIVEIVGRVGTKQGGIQVRCKVLSGRDEGKILRRNVMGPTRVGDVLLLRETEIEAAPVRDGKR